MSFLENQLSKLEKPADKEKEETAEENLTEETSAESTEQSEQQEQTTEKEDAASQESEEVVPEKLDVNYKPWLTDNEDAVYTFLKEKKTDYTTLDKAEVVRLKIKTDNPEFSAEDVEDELKDKYALGLEKVVIDTIAMDAAEIEEATKKNAEIDRQIAKGQRTLKKDAADAAKFFNDKKASLELPKFEIELPKPTAKVETFSQEEVTAKLQNEFNEQKEKYWVPSLKKVIDTFESIKEQIEYEDNGNKVVLDVDYKLSEGEKEEILKELSDYISHPSDAKYVNEKGEPDVQGFVRDKASQLQYKKLLKTVAKESAALARKSFVKNDLVNFSDDGRQRATTENVDPDFGISIFKKAAAQAKKSL